MHHHRSHRRELAKAPAWFIQELRDEGHVVTADGLANDHHSFTVRQRAINTAEQRRLDNETPVERIRRIAAAKARRR